MGALLDAAFEAADIGEGLHGQRKGEVYKAKGEPTPRSPP